MEIMNTRKTAFFSIIVLLFVFVSCNNEKESISKSIIDSYAQAVQEEDQEMMIKMFPRIVYFEEYPKIDSITISEYIEVEENILAKGTLHFTNGFGKNFDAKLELLVNPTDSIIVDVLGFLTRKKRNEIKTYTGFGTFADLKPSDEDYDATYLQRKQTAFNRIKGFEYHAQKAIGERTQIKLKSSSKVKYSYGIIMGYYNTKIQIDIRNNSDFDIKYEYIDDNYGYNYSFSGFEPLDNQKYSPYTKGILLVESNKELSQSATIKSEQTSEHVEDKISIKPVFDSVDEAIEIVKKYYDSKTIDHIMEGNKDYWKDYYNYKINVQ